MLHASLYGRLGKDAQAIATKSGRPMTVASVAVDVSPRDGEATLWVRVVAFGTAAEALAKHAKGDALSAMGRLELSQWRGDDGAERETWQSIAEHLISARTVRPRGGKTADPGEKHGKSGPGPRPAKTAAPLPFNDEIPF
jgi:single-stranded DNA-binding protein